MSKMREILEKARTEFYHCGYREGVIAPCRCPEIIDQALKKIKAKILERLPKRKDDESYFTSSNMTQQEKDLIEHWDNGYNQALSEFKKIIEEL